ncbi:ParB/RepB/Spo0J family partition protein [Rhizobium leguminosarum]|uniref:ParB/RepB/Spo0J family partition protein n=1 Tax=Rhizobium leguminosarum TaxID=384 RepID=UPI001C97DE21|nr:ParB N-terminal domain-containing protein [Rhizobium leguminosarum]MBY5516210.1 ParB N-terminal domain-containing protein [Rhizobium leguminosarum]
MISDTPPDALQPPPLVPPRPQTVATTSLRPNPHNPRVLFDSEPLATLEASIRKVGILVPLTVYQAAGSRQFTILDGQRRWICATRIGLEEVPINQVTEPSLAQNIVTMFQIHKLRKDWELMPTALKLGVLIKELDENRDAALADLTGLDVAVITRCKKLLSFEGDYQDRMLDPEPARRLSADLFIEMYPVLNDRSVRAASWYNRRQMIDAFIRKQTEKKSGFKSVTDFRKIKSYLTVARAANREDEILGRLHALVENDDITIADLEIEAARIHREAETLTRQLVRLRTEVLSIDPDTFLAEEELWQELEHLLAALRQKLIEAERRDPVGIAESAT